MTKFIFVTGGVVSSLGKGISAASLGRLLKSRGLKITMVKIDPYINVDAGTMNPFQHGEVFVTDDGAETDLDLGHYERFVDVSLSRLNNITTGQIYRAVIEKERKGHFYEGETVQVIPHITDQIKDSIQRAAKDAAADVTIVEIGGTVGDIEGQPFLEAIRQMKIDLGADNVLYIHVTLIPTVGPAGEMKTKPTQHSVRELRNVGIQPDLLICRTHIPLTKEMRGKISLFCNVPDEAIFESLNTDILYEIPLIFQEQGMADFVCERLKLHESQPDMDEWRAMVQGIKNPKHHVQVAIVGKYTYLKDAYISVVEALNHGGIANQADVQIHWVSSEEVERRGPEALLSDDDAIVVPGGYGIRGIEGKIDAVRYARENRVPFLGLCLGMQCAVIEFARNVCGLEGADSAEMSPDAPHKVLDLMTEQSQVEARGGTQRLGVYPCRLLPGSRAERIYNDEVVYERHRHRYEVNNEYRDVLAEHGMVFSGLSPDEKLVELIELEDHPFFMASQFHPEFRSRPNRAHPLFRELVKAAVARRSASGPAHQKKLQASSSKA